MASQVESIKWVPGTDFIVDGFAFKNPRCSNYFLTHFHSDHTVGLSKSFDAGVIYCSHVTAQLLLHDMGLKPKVVKPLAVGVPVMVSGVQVTPLDANHCPGAVMFLFEVPVAAARTRPVQGPEVATKGLGSPGPSTPTLPPACEGTPARDLRAGASVSGRVVADGPSNLDVTAGSKRDHERRGVVLGGMEGEGGDASGGEEGVQRQEAGGGSWRDDPARDNGSTVWTATHNILHTGDCRWQPWMREQPGLAGVRVDTVFLDTTYAAPKHTHPPQQEAVSMMVQVMRDALAEEPQTVFVVASYHIGKERAFLGAAEQLGAKVWCNEAKRAVLRLLDLPAQLMALLVDEPHQAAVHVSGWGLRPEDLQAYLDHHPGVWKRAVGIRPTGWTLRRSGGLSVRREGNVAVVGVPYSEHSSWTDLCHAVAQLRPRRLIPTVNASTPAQRRALVDRFAHLMDLSADRSRLDVYLSRGGRGGGAGPAVACDVRADPGSASRSAGPVAAGGGRVDLDAVDLAEQEHILADLQQRHQLRQHRGSTEGVRKWKGPAEGPAAGSAKRPRPCSSPRPSSQAADEGRGGAPGRIKQEDGQVGGGMLQAAATALRRRARKLLPERLLAGPCKLAGVGGLSAAGHPTAITTSTLPGGGVLAGRGGRVAPLAVAGGCSTLCVIDLTSLDEAEDVRSAERGLGLAVAMTVSELHGCCTTSGGAAPTPVVRPEERQGSAPAQLQAGGLPAAALAASNGAPGGGSAGDSGGARCCAVDAERGGAASDEVTNEETVPRGVLEPAACQQQNAAFWQSSIRRFFAPVRRIAAALV